MKLESELKRLQSSLTETYTTPQNPSKRMRRSINYKETNSVISDNESKNSNSTSSYNESLIGINIDTTSNLSVHFGEVETFDIERHKSENERPIDLLMGGSFWNGSAEDLNTLPISFRPHQNEYIMLLYKLHMESHANSLKKRTQSVRFFNEFALELFCDSDDDESVVVLPTPIDDRFVDVFEEIDSELPMLHIITERHLV